MNRKIEHALTLIGVLIVQPLFALALMIVWNNQNSPLPLDYFHALFLAIGFSLVLLLTEFIVMMYQWLYVDEIFDYHRRNNNGTKKGSSREG